MIPPAESANRARDFSGADAASWPVEPALVQRAKIPLRNSFMPVFQRDGSAGEEFRELGRGEREGQGPGLALIRITAHLKVLAANLQHGHFVPHREWTRAGQCNLH